MDITALDQAIGKSASGKGRELSLASVARMTFMAEMKEATSRSFETTRAAETSRLDTKQADANRLAGLAFRSAPLPAPRSEQAEQATRRAYADDSSEERPLTEPSESENVEDRPAPERSAPERPAPENGDERTVAPQAIETGAAENSNADPDGLQSPTPTSDGTGQRIQLASDPAPASDTGLPAVPQTTPLPAALSDGTNARTNAPESFGPASIEGQTPVQQPASGNPGQGSAPQATAPGAVGPQLSPTQASSGATSINVGAAAAQPAAQAAAQPAAQAAAQPAAQAAAQPAAQAAAQPGLKDASPVKTAIETSTPLKISVETHAQTSGQLKSLPSTGGTLFQAQQAAANGLGQQGTSLPALGQGTGGAIQPQATPSSNGGQPLFVGADAASNAQNPGAQTGQTGGQQNPQSGGQGTAGQPGFQFGQTGAGKNSFGNEATRAQFQDIMTARTARPSALGNAPSGPQGASSGQSTPSLVSSSLVTAGPGGPQSTFSATMASNVAQATPGRPGTTPGTAVDQVAVKLSSSAKDGGGKISIRLNPEELGKVDVRLEIGRDGAVRATVSADRPETLDMMQRDARALEKALQDAGLKTDSNSLQFEKHDGRNASGQQHADTDASGSGGSGTADSADEPQNSEIDTASGDGLADDGSLNLVA